MNKCSLTSLNKILWIQSSKGQVLKVAVRIQSHKIFYWIMEKCIYFSVIQEAQDDRLCKNLLQMTFRESSINLANQILYPHHIISLGLFLSKSNHKWKRLNLARCHLEDEHFSHFHQYLCVKTNKSTV